MADDLTDPDWVPPEFKFAGRHTIALCEDMIPEQERLAIIEAAVLMHEGLDFQAERVRARGQYDHAWRAADRRARGLPRKL